MIISKISIILRKNWYCIELKITYIAHHYSGGCGVNVTCDPVTWLVDLWVLSWLVVICIKQGFQTWRFWTRTSFWAILSPLSEPVGTRRFLGNLLNILAPFVTLFLIFIVNPKSSEYQHSGCIKSHFNVRKMCCNKFKVTQAMVKIKIHQ